MTKKTVSKVHIGLALTFYLGDRPKAPVSLGRFQSILQGWDLDSGVFKMVLSSFNY